uniref:TIL domain containing protein n=1 Tax=Rhipicephalus appendiculatus TaxID=34631 RepID=A0A131YPW3_RHIAP
MHCTTLLAAAIFCTIASGQEYAGSPQCGCLEVPATSSRQRDKYCRPHMTIPSERHKHRGCVCRLGLVRNAWGDCITKQECTSCKCFRDRDFNVCGRECPLVCNEPMSRSCSKSCAFGCDCLPGFVRNSRMRGRCVKATKCGFTCPQFSSFQFCSSTCAPKCGRHPRGSCVTRCTRGDCVCNQGYAEVEYNGETICVPQEQCSRYLQVAPTIAPSGNGNLSSGGSVFVPGTPTIPVNPGIITGGAAGTPVPGSLGINGNLGGGVSSGGSLLVPGTIPAQPGVVSGGAAGTPVPGSVGINGNLGGEVGSGGSVLVPVTPSIPVPPGVVTGGATGPSLSGTVGIGGSPHISSVPAGGSVVPPAGGGNQPGSFGTSGVPGAVGTYPQGRVPARQPGSTDAEGRPSIGTNGFGSVGGGLFTGRLRPNESTDSGESAGVDAAGIPQAPGVSRPGGVSAAVGTTVPNGNLASGSVGGGLLPGIVLPKVSITPGPIPPQYATAPGSPAGVGPGSSIYGTPVPYPPHKPGVASGTIPPGTVQPQYTTLPGPAAGAATSGSMYGTPGIHPQKPGANIAGVYPAGSPLIRPTGLPEGVTATTTQSVPGSPSITRGILATPTNITSSAATGTLSGVLLPSGILSAGTGIVSNGLTANGANIPGSSLTNMATASPSAVGGRTPSTIVIHTRGPSTVSTAPGLSSGTLIIRSTPQGTTAHTRGSATVLTPGSVTIAGGGSMTAPPAGPISTSGSLSGVTETFKSGAQTGVVGGMGTANAGLATNAGIIGNPAASGAASSMAAMPSLVALSTGTGGAVGTGTNFGVNTALSSASVATQAVTTAPGAFSGIPAGTATTIGGSAAGGISRIASVHQATRA